MAEKHLYVLPCQCERCRDNREPWRKEKPKLVAEMCADCERDLFKLECAFEERDYAIEGEV